MSSSPLKPSFAISAAPPKDSPSIEIVVKALNLIPHTEGGYYTETDPSRESILSPFLLLHNHWPRAHKTRIRSPPSHPLNPHLLPVSLLTPAKSQGGFHQNSARTVTIHRGHGRHVII
ncbi:DUF985 domain-containing protein [Drepanopeziza brunnea f. sp. 'multigermtubi' MB_m1]|uniref:DUF985 domain-containing protein n=1 Tax=Marssonina brunnea f. sp. multigermtubi (strain MB_m1) TaxID=1072389 RepID=K1W917_MARBU|nr:DUF985 domain-containing protein [Drepanopeziza brunnea f. sp. 'multigermtubi' MB_m1]EKD13685.1 DUF985 domain-containing protein [Drepanopeziza brunnea f. sp. 'multigermtubi' MB_m1]